MTIEELQQKQRAIVLKWKGLTPPTRLSPRYFEYKLDTIKFYTYKKQIALLQQDTTKPLEGDELAAAVQMHIK